jgi:hypothetical protein
MTQGASAMVRPRTSILMSQPNGTIMHNVTITMRKEVSLTLTAAEWGLDADSRELALLFNEEIADILNEFTSRAAGEKMVRKLLRTYSEFGGNTREVQAAAKKVIEAFYA